MEDYFIAALVGFILFLVVRTVQSSVTEPPKVAIFLAFFIIALAGLLVLVMNNALVHSGHVTFTGTRMHPTLAYMPRGLQWLSNYREWASVLTDQGFDLTTHRDYSSLLRAIYLSYGIISGMVFILLQAATCALLFIGTKPKVTAFRH